MFNPIDLAKRWRDFDETASGVLSAQGDAGAALLLFLRALGRLILLFIGWSFLLAAISLTCTFVFSTYEYLNRLDGVDIHVSVPLILSAALIVGIFIVFHIIESPNRESASHAIQANGVALWRIAIVTPVVAVAMLLLGAHFSGTVNGAMASVQSRIAGGARYAMCLAAYSLPGKAACLREFPNHWVAAQWRGDLQARVMELQQAADAAYQAAGDPDVGYTFALISEAISRLEALRAFDPSSFSSAQELRLRALRARMGGSFRDCTGCPEMTVILAPAPFAVSVFETSVGEWALCEECADPHRWTEQSQRPGDPIRWIKHDEIADYLTSVRTRAQSEHTGQRFRYQLPSAHEWLVAAGVSAEEASDRARETYSVSLPTTAEDVCDNVNGLNNDARPGQPSPPERNETCFDDYYLEVWAPTDPGTTDPTFVANAAGLYHMIGNASEWLRDPCGDRLRIIGGSRTDRPVFEGRRVQVSTDTCDYSRLGNAHRGFRVMRPL